MQQETKNIQSKRAECPELEKRNFNVDRGVMAAGAGRERERDQKEYYDIKNQRGLCQVKSSKGCERYRK